jgi:hypothetical protein
LFFGTRQPLGFDLYQIALGWLKAVSRFTA